LLVLPRRIGPGRCWPRRRRKDRLRRGVVCRPRAVSVVWLVASVWMRVVRPWVVAVRVARWTMSRVSIVLLYPVPAVAEVVGGGSWVADGQEDGGGFGQGVPGVGLQRPLGHGGRGVGVADRGQGAGVGLVVVGAGGDARYPVYQDAVGGHAERGAECAGQVAGVAGGGAQASTVASGWRSRAVGR
jgi:hypothetical protein